MRSSTNRASSGTYIDSMLKKIGVFEQVQAKIVRVDDGEAVATRIKEGHGKEFGFGGYTDVLHNQDMGGVKLVGPIPEEVQNYTMYFRCPHRGGSEPGAGSRLPGLSGDA